MFADNPNNLYPLDVSALTLGQVLTIKELEKILHIPRDHKLWWSRLLNLKSKIKRLRSRLGLTPLTMRTHKGTLVICDDEDASNYNERDGKRGIRKFRRAFRRNLHVNVAKLSSERRAKHEKTLMRQAMVTAAISGAVHRPPALPDHARKTPPAVLGAPTSNGSND